MLILYIKSSFLQILINALIKFNNIQNFYQVVFAGVLESVDILDLDFGIPYIMQKPINTRIIITIN
jgi:hypothetical protein